METAFERGNLLFAEGDYQGAEEAFGQCLETDPEDWQAAGNRANARMKLRRHDQALDDYLYALNLNPAALGVKVNLAALLKELGEFPLAEALLREVLESEPAHVDAWSNLGMVTHYALRYREAIDCHLKAIELAGPSAARLNNLANALTCDLQLDEAIMAYRAALSLAPEDACARFNLSVALLMKGQYKEAWPYYESRWEAILTRRYRDKPWKGEPLRDKTLLIWSEQGLGDTLQMIRFLPQLRRTHPDAQIILACPVSCHRLLRQLDIELVDVEAPPPPHDAQLPLLSLPGILGIDSCDVNPAPYLDADPALVADWRERLGAPPAGRKRIGIVWETGVWGVGIADHGRQNKSIPLDTFLPLLDMPDTEFVSLQLGELPAAMHGRVVAPEIGDFADTAAIMAGLDLVISVDTSVVHLAGALGIPVWVLMRAESAPFFMARGDRSVWYDSMRVWRQPRPGDWAPVIGAVRQALHFTADSPD
ncbi:tetratricopeptide repeat protein [Paludibacterium paludis]|uniref:Tetratricopeptide repeat protein n=1 Tax=Paludibacterium paludis TaxID=1225769 RepID=A0A918P4I1_9NEIS|nr:tetratricopeptide repeat protein [Paludibacterium paludis]GGY20347.1 hypothetical protein GCM10011289_24910 [Paludibacterium paludis]